MPIDDSFALHGKKIRCILFDCGNTLWSAGPQAIWQSLEHSANRRAITLLRQYVAEQDFPRVDNEQLGNNIRETINELITKSRPLLPLDEPDFVQITLEALIQQGFPVLDKAVGGAIYEALHVSVAETRVLFSDALMTLATLQARGFVLGVVTNRSWGGQPFIEDMRTFGFLDYFDPACMAVSADLGIRKPNPAIFMHALNALHCTAEETAMVGDSLSADIRGAHQLNMCGIWKPAPQLIAEVKATLPKDQPYPTAQYLLSYTYQQRALQNRPLPEHIKPDLTIEHLSELLSIFIEAKT